MGEKLVIGPINKGLQTNRTPFVIDNDSFPTLVNAYQWRGRIKRKRGTAPLCRLQRYIGTTDGSGNLTVTIQPPLTTPGVASFVIGNAVFTDPGGTSPVTLITNSVGTAVLNRSTGVLTITGLISQPNTPVIYFPTLPVMGLEDLVVSNNAYPQTLGFDTKYCYNIPTTLPNTPYDVSFYKNPPNRTINGIAYTAKTTWTPTSWNGGDYQQFWTTNYQGAFWATNGINIPFQIANVGMQYKSCASVTWVSATNLTITITESSASLVIGDWIFINEVSGTGNTSINFQTGFVTAVSNNGTTTTLTIRFPYANMASGAYTSGILQYLTNRSDTTKDCLRWYDGDPTGGTPPSPSSSYGWVNFCPPLLSGPTTTFVIDDESPAQYYLVGARLIFPFKDRILFFGPVIQTSSPNSQIYLQDTVIYSENGTPYYTASFDGSVAGAPTSAATAFTALLTPGYTGSNADNRQGALPASFFEDVPGFGGWIAAGVDQPIVSVNPNEDVLIIGFGNLQSRLVYSGNDLLPFNFFLINTEYGSSSTFSYINMGTSVITRSSRGYIATSQTQVERIDLEIPDQVFECNLQDNGAERFTAERDYVNEWIYFTYRGNQNTGLFPTQTLQYNYRDNSWAIFNECYTCYGKFRQQTGQTWATIGAIYPTWSVWNDPWNSGASTALQPIVIAGNQQGFVVQRALGTEEAQSLVIQNIVGTTVTSPYHCLSVGDYIIINNCLGTANINGHIYVVSAVQTSTFVIQGDYQPSGTYLGGGLIQRLYVPYIQTKQFPIAWEMARKTRLGAQQYLLTTTAQGQITLLIFLSQNANDPYNNLEYPSPVEIVPSVESQNNSLLYSTVLYTCPESTNLGLTPSNVNLQMPTAASQSQIWHRVNTSLLGDTVQLGFSLNDIQMKSYLPSGSSVVITGISKATSAVVTCANTFSVGQMVLILGVNGMTQINNKVLQIVAATTSSITLDLNSTAFSTYTSGGTATVASPEIQTNEIELHSIIIDVNPSQLLA